jgi:predicted nucleic acid-binding protein
MSGAYFDTGILLKLYTNEPDSAAVQGFVVGRGRALSVTDLHLTEAISALRLKEFRDECTAEQASAALSCIEEDLRNRILRRLPIDWHAVWIRCQTLARTETAGHGTRTLDTLHVASALQLNASELISSDTRQAALARACGLTVVNPCAAVK